MVVSRIVLGTYGPGACVNWEIELGMICLVTCFSRSASVTVKSGIKTLSMLSVLALAIGFTLGCTEETPPDTGAPKGGAPAVAPVKPADKGAMAPAAPPATKPADEKEKK
jgi:hypothetical protein